MSAKPFRRRHARPFRVLRVEYLETRAMFSGSPVVGAPPIIAAAPPPAITLGAINAISDLWNLEGTVTDNGKPVAGLRVDFGGVLSRYHLTATVEANGTYSVIEELRNIARGTATAQTHAQDGTASNVAMTYILNDPHHQTSSIVPTPACSDQATDNLDSFSTIAGLSRYCGDGKRPPTPRWTAPAVSPSTVRETSLSPIPTTTSIREVNSSTGLISTVAGNGVCGFSGDGYAATSAELNAPTAVAIDAAGDLFIADSGNDVIREVNSSTGLITTVAGNGTDGYSGDGYAATGAEFNFPNAVAVDAAGDVFIADSGNNVIREVDLSTGLITTVAGNGTCGYSGDGGPATSAELSYPTGVAVDAKGDLFIADSGNNVVREVTSSTGLITTVAGNGTGGYSGDGYAATSAQLDDPTGVAVDAAGHIFIADSSNGAIREVDPSTGLINTVAGNGTWGYSGDGGAATVAELSDPTSRRGGCRRRFLHCRRHAQRHSRGRFVHGPDPHGRRKRRREL